jgi:hypothetical protein
MRSDRGSADVAAALAAGAVAVAAADLWLVTICWQRRAVLGGILGAVGIPLVAFAIASGLTGSTGEAALVIALVLLIVGGALYALGQALERLLEQEPRTRSEIAAHGHPAARRRGSSTPGRADATQATTAGMALIDRDGIDRLEDSRR